MKVNYITLFKSLTLDVGLDPYTVSYCIRRIISEGLNFLTVTLPKLSRAVLRSLELGYFDRPTDFVWKRKSLRVFAKFLNKIFDPNTGLVLPNPCALSILQLRQVCDYFYKLSLPYKDTQLEEYTQRFVSVDSAVPASGEYDFAWVDSLRKRFETHFPSLTNDVVDHVLHEHAPRSGPGTYSKGTPKDGNPWYARKYMDYSVRHDIMSMAWASRPIRTAPMPSPTAESGFSELLFVPKDSRGPRTIVREPFYALRYQMAFNSYLSSSLERLTNYRVNFRNQQENRSLAESASKTREFATIDLKDASDSVSYAIISHLFRNSPALRWFLRLRTPEVLLPNGTLHKLKKLSGMGSGFTFPSMSLLIYLSVCEGISKRYGLAFRKVMKTVFVYGDDLIVPTKYYQTAIDSLKRSSLNVNTEKSFYRSHFRESCGADFFDGQDVAPTRLRLSSTDLSYDNSKISIDGPLALVSVERHCRELVKAGLLSTADLLYKMIEAHYGPLPKISGESPVIGRWGFSVPQYPMDESGTYKMVRCIIPVPVTEHFGEKCDPYIHLRSSLKTVGQGRTSGQTYGEVTVPRSVSYRRKRVSGFRLMG